MPPFIAFITGAASGIGFACAHKLAREGVHVAIADINFSGAQEAAEKLHAQGLQASAYAVDVGDEAQVNDTFQQIEKNIGTVNIAISNAGIQIIHPFEDFPFAEWQKMMRIHADGAFLTARAAYRMMRKNGGGKIIFMGSVHSHMASEGKAPYCFAKHGLLGLARVIAKEGGAHHIHTYTICPGFVYTPLVEKQIPEQAALHHITPEEVTRKVLLKDTIDHKFTTLEEVAALAWTFVQDKDGAMSGQSVLLGHGWGMI